MADEEERPFGREDSVRQCLEIIREVSAEQRTRARHLDTKAGSLAGFCAATLALNASLGAPLLTEKLSGCAQSVAAIFFSLATASLALAILLGVIGVLRPMAHDDLTDTQIDAYSDRPKVTTGAAELRMTWLRTMTDMTRSDRAAGETKARFSKWASWLLVVGVLGIAGQAGTLVVAL